MMVFLILSLVIVVGLAVALVVGKVGKDEMSAPNRTSPFELPPGNLRAEDIRSVRFDQSLRGYNMGQVDAVLDRLHQQLRQLETDRAPRQGARTPASQPEDTLGEIVQFRGRSGLAVNRDVESEDQ